MITERTLKKWRKEALDSMEYLDEDTSPVFSTNRVVILEREKRILRMTQELMDLHLMKGK